jgi:diguanylate cyclase (GGDEF)-like protein/PAS domain S-box-containing protein
MAEITYPDDVPAAARASNALVQGEVDSFTLEKRYVRADGSLMWGRLTATGLRAEDGKLEACLGAIEDVTEQIRNQQMLAEHEARLRMALESASMWTFDRDLTTGLEIRWGALLEEFGLAERGEFDEFLSLLHPDDSNMIRPDGLLGDEDEFVMNVRLRTVSGEYRWVQRRGSVVRDGQGRPIRVTGTSMDITQERLAEIRGAEAEANLSRVIEASPDAFVSFDSKGIVTRWNPAAKTIFGWSQQEAVGRPGSHFLVPFEQLELARAFFQGVSGDVGPGDHTRGPMEMTGLHRDGRRVPLEASWVAAIVGNELRISAFIRDLTERKASQAELERLALVDPLTGLPNRALMHDRLQGALGRMKRHGRKVGVLFLDLDRFKVVNDSLGHDAGDSLLCVLGDRISRVLRSGDTLGRLGGDEFVVVAEEIGDARDLASLAERILAAVSQPLHLQGYEIAPSASIGIAVAEEGSGDTESLLRDADLAMYRAKARGGGDYELFDFEMRQRAMSRLASEGELRRAVGNDELRVHYQPYLEADGKLHGVEALVRWLHPERGLVAPAEFIGLAEETGLVVPLGEWVLRAACRQAKAWRTGPHPDLTLSVNLSVRQLAQPRLTAVVAGILEETGLEASALCLEITETALMQDPGAAAVTLGELRRLGVRIAVDDFGTGYSSLLYLRHFPIQILKLDTIFVSGVCENSEDRVIIGSIIELAHALGLTAVAEGVETVAQLHALQALGCDLMQGYYWSRPLDAESMTARLQGSNHLSPDRTFAVTPTTPPPRRGQTSLPAATRRSSTVVR